MACYCLHILGWLVCTIGRPLKKHLCPHPSWWGILHQMLKVWWSDESLSLKPVFVKWRKIWSNNEVSSPDLAWRILELVRCRKTCKETIMSGNTCMGHHRGSQLWWKPQHFQANLCCPKNLPPCLQPWHASIITSKLRRAKHWNGIWDLVTYFDKALLNLSDRGHSSFSLLQYNPRYHSLEGPEQVAS